jgi:CRISPR-associated protein Cmr2
LKYVVALSFGPVQEFIVAARRTRDLWFGSALLSQASRAAAELLRQQGAQLIFPTGAALDSQDEYRGNVSNKLLLIVEADEAGLRVLVQRAVSAAREVVQTLARGIFEDQHLGAFDGAPHDQVDDLLESYWAAAPMATGTQDEAGSYAQARAEAERLLAARKNTRDFRPVGWGSSAPKSALDGQRESVIHGQLGKNRRLGLGIRAAEQLCAPGLVKRLGQRGDADEKRFMSTSHVAAQPYLARLAQMDQGLVQQDWARYLDTLGRLGLPQEILHPKVGGTRVLGRHDGRLLYASRLDELAEGGDAIPSDAAQQALSAFLRAHPASSPVFGTVPPDPYYAVFQADGDGMGSLIDAMASQGPAQHAALSDALSGFATQAGRLVEAAQGSLIYAGGDDVLALLPLHTALACVGQLSASYKAHLSSFGPAATLSGGLVIAHFLTPLQDTLLAARQTEKAAKALTGKDALAISLRRRSGAPLGVLGRVGPLTEALDTLITLYLQDELPGKLAYDVRVLAGDLGPAAPLALATVELGRILKRKKAERSARFLGADVVTQVSKLLQELSQAPTTESSTEAPERRDHAVLRQLSDLLIVAHALARAQAQAGLTPPPQAQEMSA